MKNVRSDKKLKSTSKFISLILRHKPEVIGIALDEHGWADLDALIKGVNQAYATAQPQLKKLRGYPDIPLGCWFGD